ncbi:MAG: hypothetical protein AUI14_23120 [Actinobacteria bacterium 13_2_20CM_2_71_6]|nr:MAG: hypothetical protein AUI14_23120 [Actinobacteria bacterium 13_2_20CM_2_71_6]
MVLDGQSPLGEILATPSSGGRAGTGWRAGDPRWRVQRIDTTGRPVDACAADLEAWIAQQRAAHTAGSLPLARGWHR